ncbi:AI-2E family transporter [Hyphomicrobium methylovorum]|uniref:AI-2E family transporter n=1 Tax=Hyphomicrobium methylovorum TaxID=84 RepID=UPI0015E689DD|nr:AI-2E family transporter [Hyphomicrobium methylovorum]MBA2125782.1 AI-2E family transporter [Hyphomicrobium methylovorum]
MLIERHALFWLATALLFAYLVQLLAPVLLPFVIGLTLAYFLNPIVDAMSRIGIPRWASSILVLAVSLFLIGFALVFIVPILVQQIADFVEAAPHQIERLKALAEANAREYLGARYPQAEATARSAIEATSSALPALLAGVAQSIWNQGSAAFNFVSVVLVTPIVFFYTLKDWPKLVAKVDSWLPRDNAEELRDLSREINHRVSAFIRGQGVVCIILACYYAGALSIAGLQYGLLVGLCTGLASFIPVVGWSVGTLTAVGLAIVQYWPDTISLLIVIAIMLGGQALESAVLSPNIIGSEVGLHPVWLIFALLTFSYLFGFLGLLVAVPVSAAIGVLVRYAIRSYLASSVYRGNNSPA